MPNMTYFKSDSQRPDSVDEENNELLPDAPPAYLNSVKTSEMKSSLFILQRPAIIFKDLILVLLAVAALVTYAWRPAGCSDAAQVSSPAPPATLPGCNCGKSIREAKKMGCKFDTLATAWLPSHCRDEELTEMFDKAGPGPNGTWTYWLDRQKTTPISIDELARLADSPKTVFYNTHTWHMKHCMFYWRKAIRAQRLGTVLEPRYSSEGHAAHCAMMLDLDPEEYMTATSVALNSNLD